MRDTLKENIEIQFLKPAAHVLQPDFVIADIHSLEVRDINERDRDKSIGLIIFDVDNTLEDYLSPTVSEETSILLTRLRGAGYTLAIASNCNETRGEQLRAMFGEFVDVIATPEDARRDMNKRWGKKPTTGMYEYIQLMLGNQFSSAQTMMVGDQILKDVLFGKQAHIKTTLTQKFGEHDHPSVEKYQRDLERKLLLAMGASAVDGTIQFPSKLTPFRQWVRAESGLVVPQSILESRNDETKEY